MKNKIIFLLVLISSVLNLPKNKVLSVIKNPLKRGYQVATQNFRPLNKIIDRIQHPSRYPPKKSDRNPNLASPLLYDTTQSTDNITSNMLNLNSVKYYENNKDVITVSDPNSKNIIRLEQDPVTGKQSTMSIKKVSVMQVQSPMDFTPIISSKEY